MFSLQFVKTLAFFLFALSIDSCKTRRAEELSSDETADLGEDPEANPSKVVLVSDSDKGLALFSELVKSVTPGVSIKKVTMKPKVAMKDLELPAVQKPVLYKIDKKCPNNECFKNVLNSIRSQGKRQMWSDTENSLKTGVVEMKDGSFLLYRLDTDKNSIGLIRTQNLPPQLAEEINAVRPMREVSYRESDFQLNMSFPHAKAGESPDPDIARMQRKMGKGIAKFQYYNFEGASFGTVTEALSKPKENLVLSCLSSNPVCSKRLSDIREYLGSGCVLNCEKQLTDGSRVKYELSQTDDNQYVAVTMLPK